MIDQAELANRFVYDAPSPGQVERYQWIGKEAAQLAILINEQCPDGREKKLAITHLETAVMWANAAIARHG